MSNFNQESVLSVHHWTDTLFSFTTTRDPSFRFRNGEFTMIGLKVGEKPLLRAYSVASANYEDRLEFFSIKVPDGPLTSELQKIQPGDTILMRQKATGTLVVDALTPAKRLFMISTGTGFAPFASLLRDPETYEKFETVVATHTCRDTAELAYGKDIVAGLETDPLIGEFAGGRVTLYSTTTREPSSHMGRITALIESGKFYDDLGIDRLDPATDRVMICGSMHMLKDVKELVESLGFKEGSVSHPGDFVVERAFVG
jgi:ferredoxin--NADP+ reductase